MALFAVQAVHNVFRSFFVGHCAIAISIMMNVFWEQQPEFASLMAAPSVLVRYVMIGCIKVGGVGGWLGHF